MSDKSTAAEFESKAGEKRQSFVSEFVGFLKDNKKWWMIPVIVVLLLIGGLLIAGGSGVAPFIYTLF